MYFKKELDDKDKLIDQLNRDYFDLQKKNEELAKNYKIKN